LVHSLDVDLRRGSGSLAVLRVNSYDGAADVIADEEDAVRPEGERARGHELNFSVR
jgi:hypothetical protein